MRCKILLLAVLGILASVGFGQDINRASEWHTKRAEQSEAQVMQEMKFNGTTAPVGMNPNVLDENGNPLAESRDKSGGMVPANPQAAAAIGKQTDRLSKSEFGIADNAVDTPEKPKTSAVLVGSICLILGLLLVVAFHYGTQKIKVPANL